MAPVLLFEGSSGAGVDDVVDVEVAENVSDMGVRDAENDVLDGEGLNVAGSIRDMYQQLPGALLHAPFLQAAVFVWRQGIKTYQLPLSPASTPHRPSLPLYSHYFPHKHSILPCHTLSNPLRSRRIRCYRTNPTSHSNKAACLCAQ